MMREVKHGIAIGLTCVVLTITLGSFIGQALSDGPDMGEAESAPAEVEAQDDAPAEDEE